ncbi:AGRD2 protein, partial [Amia calva]|nr:AGRD2 protein [Amia calva]
MAILLLSCLLPHFPKGHKFTYKYVPGCRPWREAEQECEQSSGALATVTTAQENRELTSFLQALNITEQVWIESPVMDHKLRAPDSLILEFSGWDYWLELRCSIVLKVFSYTPAWTVCASVQFEHGSFGDYIVFSFNKLSKPFFEMACEAVTALLYLFFLAAFTWMLVEGLLLWSKVVIVNLCEVKRMKYYYLIGWGLPVFIVSQMPCYHCAGWWWWCNGVGDVFLAHFRPLSANWASFKCHGLPEHCF